MTISQDELKEALTCAHMAKEIYLKFPEEIARLPDIDEALCFKQFTLFPDAEVTLHHCDPSDTQCAFVEEGAHLYIVFRGTEKKTDWATNVEFSRKLFQVRNKNQGGGETAVAPSLDDDDAFLLPVEGEGATGMSHVEDDDDAFFLPPDEEEGLDDVVDMHFEQVDEGAKHFELVSGLESASVASHFPRAQMHLGFVSAYMTVQDFIHEYLLATQPEQVTVTGHSLGGALAMLCAVDIKLTYLGKHDVSMYTFGAPKVGNEAFPEFYETAVPQSFRFVNGRDLVPNLPHSWQGYHHAGQEVRVNDKWSWRLFSRRIKDHFMPGYIKGVEALID